MGREGGDGLVPLIQVRLYFTLGLVVHRRPLADKTVRTTHQLVTGVDAEAVDMTNSKHCLIQ